MSAALCASALTWGMFRVTALLPKRLRIRALVGTSQVITDLAVPVGPGRDHVRGPRKSPVTVVEYGDFECPYCGQAEPVVRELLADLGDVRYVWRHLPLNDVHPHAQLAAEGAEAAARHRRRRATPILTGSCNEQRCDRVTRVPRFRKSHTIPLAPLGLG